MFSDEDVTKHIEVYIGLKFADFVATEIAKCVPADANILDIGSGYGSFVYKTRRMGFKTFGVEIATFDISYARRRNNEADNHLFIQADGLLLPFANEFFDAVTLWNALEHIEDQKKVLSEAKRVLKPGGKLFIICPNYAAFRPEAHYQLPWLPLFPRKLAHHYLKLRGRDPLFFDKNIFYTTNLGVQKNLRELGFTVSPLLNPVKSNPFMDIDPSSGFLHKLANPNQIETKWKRWLIKLLKIFRIDKLLKSVVIMRAIFQKGSPYSNYIKNILLKFNPFTDSILLTAEKPPKKLMVIVPDSIPAIIEKGEYPPRYYNPEDFFDEVHILMVNEAETENCNAQKTVGSAELTLYKYPTEPIAKIQQHFLFKPWILKRSATLPFLLLSSIQKRRYTAWANNAVKLAKMIKPDLIRCYGHQSHTFLAYQIKKKVHTPYIVSLHGNPDVDYYRGRLAKTDEQKIIGHLSLPLELAALKKADHVIAVYSPIVEYFQKHDIESYSVIYNVVGIGSKQKENYTVEMDRINCLCVGRQQSEEKNPLPIIEAVANLPNVFLTLIGKGDIHEYLKQKVLEWGLENRIKFIPEMDNKLVLSYMNQADIFIYSSMNFEISKGCMEAALIGLPIIINDRNGKPAKELVGDHFYLVDGSSESYQMALSHLISNENSRECLGKKAREYAKIHWSPDKIEKDYVKIYENILAP